MFFMLILLFDLNIKAVSGLIVNDADETLPVSSMTSDEKEMDNSFDEVFANVIISSIPSAKNT